MSAYTVTNPYVAHAVIQHDDVAVVAAFQAAYPGGREGLSPVSAAALYGAGGPAGDYTGLPWIFVDYLPTGLDVTLANGTFVDAVGDTAYYIWAIFMTLAGPGVPIDPSPEAIMQRRFITGFELPQGGEVNNAFGVQANMISRSASRTPEGFGLAWRDRAQIVIIPLTTLTGGGVSAFRGSWERVYVRCPRLPTANTVFWRCRNTANNNAGASIQITPAGGLQIYNIDSANASTLIATSTINLTLNVWAKLDLVVEFSSGGSGRFRLWVNGVAAVDVTVATGDGLDLVGFHSSSELFNTADGNDIELDVDDWINAEVPLLFTGLDWISGSHITQLKPTAYEASHSADWTGDFRVLIQNPPFRANAEITSTTSGARLAVETDAQLLANRGAEQSGVASMAVGIYSRHDGGVDGQIGYSIDGGADVFVAASNETSSYTWSSILYRPSGMITPADIHPLVLLHTKGASAETGRVRMLMAAVEYLGAWGAVDQATDTDSLPETGVHNAPYATPDGLWGGIGTPPYGQVTIQAGTYVGNGTGQDIDLDAPAHWFCVRRTDLTSGARWWSSMIGTHAPILPKQIECDLMVQAFIDDTGQAKLRIAGDNSKANGAGLTYQYVIFSDPGMRYLLNGAFFHSNNLASALSNLVDETFYAEAGFFFNEGVSDQGAAGGTGWYKGKGHAADRASQFSAAETAAVLTFGLGTILSQTAIHIEDESVAYSLWRIYDGPGGPDGPGTSGCDPDDPTSGCAVAITSYVGDGTASRDIAVALCDKFPLWAWVVPHNGGSWLRDPSHTGLNSSNAQLNGDSTTRIIGGGVNKITVGVDLNATGIIYDVFVLPGGTTGSGGWATNGTYYPVTIGPPCGPEWPPAPPPTPPAAGSACPDDFPQDLDTGQASI